MSDKHTPGPWRLRELANGTFAVYGEGEYDIIFPLRSGGIDTNARLILRAPEIPALEAALTEKNRQLNKCCEGYKTLEAENAALRKQVERLGEALTLLEQNARIALLHGIDDGATIWKMGLESVIENTSNALKEVE